MSTRQRQTAIGGAVEHQLVLSAAGTSQVVQKERYEDNFTRIIIFTEKESQGSQWDSTTGEAKYMVSYKVTLDNFSNKSIEPGKDNKICFFLFDKNDKSESPRII
ncbi:UNVERIFIED_ORG: putative membrane protein [Pantoea agglomerans]